MATWGYYGTLAEHNAYWASHGNPSTWTGATDAVKTAAFVTASEYLDAKYGTAWKGWKAVEGQVLAWPRSGVVDNDYRSVSSTTVPQTIKDVVSILAHEVIKGVVLMPDVAAGEIGAAQITGKTEKVGPISESTTYAEGSATISTMPRFRRVSAMLRASGLIHDGGRVERG